MLATYQSAFAQLLEKDLGILSEVLQEQITLAPDNIEGDLAFPCFRIAKDFGKNPAELAKNIVEKLGHEETQIFSSFLAVGPYVNAVIKEEVLAQEVLTEILEKKYDYGRGEENWKQILVEGRNINTHKAIHIGHTRNILMSESIARIENFAGYTVVKVCYPGDIGAHVAKWMWYYLNFYPEKGKFPFENVTKWVGEIYTLATKKVDENPDYYKAEIEALQKKLEDGDPELQTLWKETRELCLQDLKKILAELGTESFDKRYFESEVEQLGIQIVQKMLADGIAQYSEGAVAINLEEWKLGRFLLLKSTWASLYSTKDIALAYKKHEDFPNYTTSLYVVGSEQEHHFQQLFKTLEILGIDPNKLHHLSYGLLDLKEGKMSSRAGNVILYEDFRDQLIEQAEALMADREIPAEQKKQTARAVAFGSLKFWILLQDSEKKILFDPEQALSFEGETGPYLQYTYARINSILKKSSFVIASEMEWSVAIQSIHPSLLNTSEDKSLLLQLSKFSEEVQKSAQSYKPNYIARFCLDTAQLFNSYYHNHKIIDETNPELSQARLCLIQSVQQVLKNGLELLGIDTVESM